MYVVTTRAGNVKVLNMNFDVRRQLKIESRAVEARFGVWVSAVVTMPNLGLLAVACTADFIAFYMSRSIRVMERLVIIDKLAATVSSMNYWFAILHHALWLLNCAGRVLH